MYNLFPSFSLVGATALLQGPRDIDDVDCLSPLAPERDIVSLSVVEACQQLCHARETSGTSAAAPAAAVAAATAAPDRPRGRNCGGGGDAPVPFEAPPAAAPLADALADIPFVGADSKLAVQRAVALGLLHYDAALQRVSMPPLVAAALTHASGLDDPATAAATAAAITVVMSYATNKLAAAARLFLATPQAALAAMDRDGALVSQMLEWTGSAAATGAPVAAPLLACWEAYPLLRHCVAATGMDDWLRHCVAVAKAANSDRAFAQVRWAHERMPSRALVRALHSAFILDLQLVQKSVF